jgi:cytochrome c553
MRRSIAALTVLLAACRPAPENSAAVEVPFGFDGAAYGSEAAKVAHGERLAGLLFCTACHGPDLGGMHMGDIIPELQGLFGTNIALTMPAMSDVDLERLLRRGLHPTREALYVMPSKSYSHLSEWDMRAHAGRGGTSPCQPRVRLFGRDGDRPSVAHVSDRITPGTRRRHLGWALLHERGREHDRQPDDEQDDGKRRHPIRQPQTLRESADDLEAYPAADQIDAKDLPQRAEVDLVDDGPDRLHARRSPLHRFREGG